MTSAAPSLDAEHGVQFELLGALSAALGRDVVDRPAVAALLRQLFDFSEAHFLSEQLLMRLYGYPDYQAHTQWHDQLLERLRTVASQWTAGGSGAAQEVVSGLEEWLHVHIREADGPLAAYLAEHGPRAT